MFSPFIFAWCDTNHDNDYASNDVAKLHNKLYRQTCDLSVYRDHLQELLQQDHILLPWVHDHQWGHAPVGKLRTRTTQAFSWILNIAKFICYVQTKPWFKIYQLQPTE